MVKKFYLVLNTFRETIEKLGLISGIEWGVDEYYKIYGKLPSIEEQEKHEKKRFKDIMKEIGIDVKDIKSYDSTSLTPLSSLVAYKVLLEKDLPYRSIEEIFEKYFGTTLPLWKKKPKLPHSKDSSDPYVAFFPHR